MTAQLLIKAYWHANLVIVAGYLLSRAGLRWAASRGMSYRPLTRIAQCLLVLTLALPAGLALLPRDPGPGLPRFELLQPLPESGPASARRALRPGAGAAAQALRVPPPSSRDAGLWLTRALRLADSARGARAALGLLVAVVALGLLRVLRDWLRLRALVGRAIPIRRAGRARVLVTGEAAVPFSVLAGGAACVLVPESLLGRAHDLRIAVRHELQHHRRGDTAWARWIELWLCAFAANPFAHFWKNEITELQELSCDEALIGHGKVSAHDYGSCLIRVAEAALGSRSMPAGTACMASASGNPKRTQSFLRRRVHMFPRHQNAPGRLRAGAALGTALALITAAAAYASQPSGARIETAPKPNPGTPVLSPEVQAIAQEALRHELLERPAEGGFVIVSEPSTGRLLAVANTRHGGDPDSAPWALARLLEPASAIKTVIAASAIEHGATRLGEVHDCEGGHYRWDGHVYGDYTNFSHLSTADTIVYSSNICGIKVGLTLGSYGIARALSEFGFGPGGTAQSFPGAVPGRVPAPGELPESEYIPLASTGYSAAPGFYVSPLELVQAYGAIANGGILLRPQQASGTQPEPLGRILSDETARQMRLTLARAVREGTGKAARSDLYTTAGKTSTAYDPFREAVHEKLGGEVGIAGFIGFAPVDNPRVLVYAGVIRPMGDHPQGGVHAAPLFKRVVERVLEAWHVAPDASR